MSVAGAGAAPSLSAQCGSVCSRGTAPPSRHKGRAQQPPRPNRCPPAASVRAGVPLSCQGHSCPWPAAGRRWGGCKPHEMAVLLCVPGRATMAPCLPALAQGLLSRGLLQWWGWLGVPEDAVPPQCCCYISTLPGEPVVSMKPPACRISQQPGAGCATTQHRLTRARAGALVFPGQAVLLWHSSRAEGQSP